MHMPNRREFIRWSGAWGGAAALGRFGPDSKSSLTFANRPSVADEPVAPAAKPMRILILGGTGLTGPHQVKYALARGHTVTVFNRGRNNGVLPAGVEELRGDRNLHEVAPLRGRDWDAVIDNPTMLPFWVKDVADVLRGHVKQYVFISTVSVYDTAGHPGQHTITEDSPLAEYKGGDPLAVTQKEVFQNINTMYGQMKTASEREAKKQFGDATTIIRPTLIVGPGDDSFRFGYWPYRVDRGGEILAPGDGTDAVQLIDARDLAEWTIRLVENGTTGVFNAVGPRSPLSMAEMLYGIRGALPGDEELSFTWVPATFLAEQKVAAWSDMPVWIPGSDPDSVQSKVETTRSVAAGLTYRPLATTTVETLAWYQGLSAEGKAKVVKGAGITPERERDALAAWHRRGK
jgi:2'-hydroxyisoflavone reductase